MENMTHSYDFVIVGAGPAGCVLAARLASSPNQPMVLLLEAGGDNANETLRIDGERAQMLAKPGLNWGYRTAPQTNLKGRIINYFRGKGLGGSSAINFSAYVRGSRDDYDEWARSVGDDSFNWDRIQRRFEKLEDYHAPRKYQEHVQPVAGDYGRKRALDIRFPKTWERDVPELLNVFEKAGYPMNKDLNSGDPLGMGVAPNSAYRGWRTTAADLLIGAPSNLVIQTNAVVNRVLIRNKSAIGVEANGTQYFASKDVILFAGSLDSPKILMLSGIGPAAELTKYGIEVVQDIPYVGKGLRDHLGAFHVFRRANGTTDRPSFYGNASALPPAREQWFNDRTGPLTIFSCAYGMGYFKANEIYESAEFKALPKKDQRFMLQPTTPSWEALTHLVYPPDRGLSPTEDYWAIVLVLMNLQSKGEVTLQSSNPADPLIYDPKFLTHPYDCRVAIEAGRALMDFTGSPAFTNATIASFTAPKSSSEDDVWEFLQTSLNSMYHPMGTVKMGRPGQAETCVDSNFAVLGVDNLRVSVAPLLMNNHPQSTAYMIGATLAEKLIAQYLI